jgi:hypothetical protein|tara:strand:- start:2791 stop:2982 length:192 start_codon:yes stop_codon:yes gene_type:complete
VNNPSVSKKARTVLIIVMKMAILLSVLVALTIGSYLIGGTLYSYFPASPISLDVAREALMVAI